MSNNNDNSQENISVYIKGNTLIIYNPGGEPISYSFPFKGRLIVNLLNKGGFYTVKDNKIFLYYINTRRYVNGEIVPGISLCELPFYEVEKEIIDVQFGEYYKSDKDPFTSQFTAIVTFVDGTCSLIASDCCGTAHSSEYYDSITYTGPIYSSLDDRGSIITSTTNNGNTFSSGYTFIAQLGEQVVQLTLLNGIITESEPQKLESGTSITYANNNPHNPNK